MINKVSMGSVCFKNAPINRTKETICLQESKVNSLPKPPIGSLLAYLQSQVNKPNVKAEYFNSISVIDMVSKYSESAECCVKDLESRAGVSGQVLNWIKVLPQTQLSRIDEIYALADSLKANGSQKLAIIGIGGSKHTVENLLTLLGYDDKVFFLSAVDDESLNRFFDKKLASKENLAVIVASKSGTTLEPSYDFEVVRQKLGDDFKNYVCITDKDISKSKLRQIANEKGYKCGIIHDDCGGRFGAFDDHALVALAYCGLPKSEMKKLLTASVLAQQKFLNPDISQNTAIQRAIFNTHSVVNSKTNQYDYYFGDCFESTTLWNTQLKKESHKSLYKPSGDLIGPAFLHNSTESDLDEGNTTSFYTFNKVGCDYDKKNTLANALFEGSLKAYSNKHPVSVITLKDLSVESIAEYIELKHFETIYTGMMLRKINSKNTIADSVLPEVLQPHVGIYKKEVNKILDKQ